MNGQAVEDVVSLLVPGPLVPSAYVGQKRASAPADDLLPYGRTHIVDDALEKPRHVDAPVPSGADEKRRDAALEPTADVLMLTSLSDASRVPHPLAASSYGSFAVSPLVVGVEDVCEPLPSIEAALPEVLFRPPVIAASIREAHEAGVSSDPNVTEKSAFVDGLVSLGSVVPRQPIAPVSGAIRIEPIAPRLDRVPDAAPSMNIAERMATAPVIAPAANAPAANFVTRPATDATVAHVPAAGLDVPGSRRGLWDWLKLVLRLGVYALVAWLVLIFGLMMLYRFVDPPMSSLMLQQRLAGGEVVQNWVSLDYVSPQIVRAVIASEDGRFCQHSGVDFDAMQDALDDGAMRGASTISMQVVKNLFLWPSKSYVRKAIEIPLTWMMEVLWSKRRIMEVYLNIAEWGPGIFGVEEASRFHFNKVANRLNEREAAQLAVALPNPYLRDAGAPGPKTRKLARDIQIRMRSAFKGQTSCVLDTRR